MDIEVKKVSLGQHLVILLFVVVGTVFATKEYQFKSFPEVQATVVAVEEAVLDKEPIVPIPLSLDLDRRKVSLGERLYHDLRLSHDNKVSCASCHDLKKGGTDQVQYSTGINDALGGINAPTTFNSGFIFAQFWDGRATDLEEQVSGPVHNPIEMGSNWQDVLVKLGKDSSYIKAFDEIYPDGMNAKNITDAIAEFERSLFTPNSRFDQYLRGNKDALTAEEKAGYRLFKEYGCVSCHQGIAMGGNLYQTLGVMDDYFLRRPNTKADLGRYNVTKNAWNRHQFKVPTLRNIAITPPYLHDGSAKTLEDVLMVMWKSQLGRSVKPEELTNMVKFLNTLTGTYKGEPL